MTPLGWLGRKTSTQTNKHNWRINRGTTSQEELLGDQSSFFFQKVLIVFLFLDKNIYCGYLSEALLMNTDNICFCEEIRKIIVFLFLNENIYCGYSSEVPRWGASNEYPQHMFSSRNKKNIIQITLAYVAIWLKQVTRIVSFVNPSLAEHDKCSKQCRSRSVGFWRSQLIWICTVYH